MPNDDVILEVSAQSSIWDDLGITHFLRCAQSRKWVLLIIPFLWLAISNVWFRMSETTYAGSLQVVPATVGTTAVRASGASGFLGASGLEGLLGGRSSNDETFMIYAESWTAPWFAQVLVDDKALTQRIFSREWSTENNQWKTPAGRMHQLTDFVRSAFGNAPRVWHPPDAETMLQFLKTHITVIHNRTEVIGRIELEGPDRPLIEDILKFGDTQIEDHIRKLFQKRAEENIGYILGELPHVTVVEYRNALVQQLAQQEEIRMMSFANEEFAAQSLGLFVATTPVRPRISVIVPVSLMLALVGYAILLFLVAPARPARRAVPRVGGYQGTEPLV